MSELAKKAVMGSIAALDRDIAWRTDDLVHSNTRAVELRAAISELRAQRRELLDFIETTFKENA